MILLLFASVARAANRSAVAEVLLMLLVFLCVVLHECGHAAAARRFGIATGEIVLYPFGGIARLERIPAGKAEIVIAVAGPLVNAALAAALFAAHAAAGAASGLGHDALVGRAGLVQRVFVANVALFVFNLIPPFPIDDGRILRGALALALPVERATRIAAWVGQGCAVAFAAFGFLLPFPNNFLPPHSIPDRAATEATIAVPPFPWPSDPAAACLSPLPTLIDSLRARAGADADKRSGVRSA